MALAEKVANEKFGGHLTILKFTSHWKVAFGTPNLDGTGGRSDVAKLTGSSSLKEALISALVNHTSLY
jgi:hypothetical protein